MELPRGTKTYGTGIGAGIGLAAMFPPQPTDPPSVIIAKLILIAACPIASIIGDAIEKYAKARYGVVPNAAAQVAAAVTAVIPPAEPPKV